jgi:hypothetical protein
VLWRYLEFRKVEDVLAHYEKVIGFFFEGMNRVGTLE